jgi:hypothetical protein
MLNAYTIALALTEPDTPHTGETRFRLRGDGNFFSHGSANWPSVRVQRRDERGRLDTECMCDAGELFDAGVRYATFDVAEVAETHIRGQGDSFLREIAALPGAPDTLAHFGADRARFPRRPRHSASQRRIGIRFLGTGIPNHGLISEPGRHGPPLRSKTEAAAMILNGECKPAANAHVRRAEQACAGVGSKRPPCQENATGSSFKQYANRRTRPFRSTPYSLGEVALRCRSRTSWTSARALASRLPGSPLSWDH